MLTKDLARRVQRTALVLGTAGAMVVSGALVTAGPAAAATPSTTLATSTGSLVAACVRTGNSNVSASLKGTVVPGLLGVVTVTIRDIATGKVIGTQVGVQLLGGEIDLPAIGLPLPSTSTQGVAFTVSNLLGTIGEASTPCLALPTAGLVGSYFAVGPTRILDTRTGFGGTTIPANGQIDLQVTGKGGVPRTGAEAVYLNFVATRGVADGYLTVFPTGGTRPGVSSLNYVPGINVANASITQLGAGGKITIRNTGAQPVDLVGDVSGYFLHGLAQGLLLPGAYQPVAPTRVMDTRRGLNGGKLIGDTPRTLRVVNKAGVPVTAGSVVVNLTAVNGSRHSHITAYPTGEAIPNASNDNYTGSKPAANLAVVKIGSNGSINLKNGIPETNVDLVVDVVGYFAGGLLPAQTPGLESRLTPSRLLDTRTGNGLPLGKAQKVAAGGTVTLQVAGRGGVPSTSVNTLRAVLVTVTTTQQDGTGDIVAYPSGTTPDTTSVLSFIRFTDIANLAIVPVGDDGKIKLINRSGLPAHLVVDVAGYITGDTVGVG